MDENVYGNQKRLHWIKSYLTPGDRILEIGCGTGVMISLPLAQDGIAVTGNDDDIPSIKYGGEVLESYSLDTSILVSDMDSIVPGSYDVIIASEVIEHISDSDMKDFFDVIHRFLKPGGLFLATVPNGYGWFEIENILWSKLYLGRILSFFYVDRVILEVKQALNLPNLIYSHPSTLSSSPHLQRFTAPSICRLIEDSNFHVLHSFGSTLVSGPISNMLFSGLPTFFGVNNYLGHKLKYVASGFYVVSKSHEVDADVN